MNSIENIFNSLGFTKIQIELYIDLLEHHDSSISNLSQRTGYHRPAIYHALPSLIDQGLLVEVLEGKRKRYRTTNPVKLYDLVENLERKIDTVLPGLSEIYTQSNPSTAIVHLKGKSGIGKAFLDVADTLARGDHFYRYSSATDQANVDTYVPKNYRRKRDAKQLTRDVITNKRAGNQKKLRLERNIKFIDTDELPFKENIIQFMYGDKISLLDFNTENAYIIENKEMADFQRNIFKILFSKL